MTTVSIVKKVKPDPIDNTERVKEFRLQGGQILHIRPRRGGRGMTFAFRQKGNRVEVATALQHRSDDFAKKNGTKVAIEHFNEGKTIFLPIGSGERAVDFLRWFGASIV